MNMQRARWHHLLLAVAAVVAVAAMAGAASARPNASGPIKVGIVYSKTGLLSAYGAEYTEGLRYGLQYATNGTGKVNGRSIQLTLVDDAGDPAKAISAGKDLIGQGYKILAGSTSSGVALQMAPLAAQNQVLFISGPAASDAITGVNQYTFRSGRQTWQDVATAESFLGGQSGKSILVFAQDTAFGNGNYAAVNAVLGGHGHKVSKLLVPLSANDFTPFAQQAKQANPDLLFVAWAGTTAPAMWTALEQQGAFGVSNKIVTGLAERATWQTMGGAATKIQFLSHYVYTAPKNKANDWLVAQMKKRNQVPDLFTPDGFAAAQMIVHALQASPGDVSKMIGSLEGWSFLTVKGWDYVRPHDHALLQPMFQVKLTQQGGKLVPVVLKRLGALATAPPQK
jgi:branched-chain amino acid transport system substrate-binding protein